MRWLGSSSRIVSFSSEKGSSGFRNTLLLTDVRNRATIAFRDTASESSPMLGIRASPLGRYLLLLLRGAPSEIWLVSYHQSPPLTVSNLTASTFFCCAKAAPISSQDAGQPAVGKSTQLWRTTLQVGGTGRPSRIRVLDLPYTAVEWVIPNDAPTTNEPMPPPKRTIWQVLPLASPQCHICKTKLYQLQQLVGHNSGFHQQACTLHRHLQRSPLSKERSLSGYSWDDSEGSREAQGSDTEDHPEERLAFALSDGRLGVLSVKGRKVRTCNQEAITSDKHTAS